MRKYILCLLLVPLYTTTFAQAKKSVWPVTIASPDKQIVFRLFEKDKQLYFNTSRQGKSILDDAPMSFSIDGKAVTERPLVISAKTYRVNETYPTRGYTARLLTIVTDVR